MDPNEMKPWIEQCAKVGCAMEMPIGYLSPRKYCADCEWREGRKLLRESVRAGEMLRSVGKLVEKYNDGYN